MRGGIHHGSSNAANSVYSTVGQKKAILVKAQDKKLT